MSYRVHSVADAPESARATLTAVEKHFGLVPNMLGTMAASPRVLEAYQTTGALFDRTSLNATERQVVMLATSAANGCGYCMSAHTALSAMQKVPGDVVAAIRDGNAIADSRLEALRRFTADVVETRGYPSQASLAAVAAAGFGEQQILEILLGIGLKTIANYINHIAGTPLDAGFASLAWTRPGG